MSKRGWGPARSARRRGVGPRRNSSDGGVSRPPQKNSSVMPPVEQTASTQVA